MESLLERLEREHSSLDPVAPHLARYATECDKYARGELDPDRLQLALCTYLDSSARRGTAVSRAINRRVEPPLADLFTEAVVLAIDGVVRSVRFAKFALTAHSERPVKVSSKFVKPDVSVWRGEEPVAVVECKTNLGYDREGWEQSFEHRARRLRDVGVRGVYLLVATEENWTGFPQSDERLHASWFALCPKRTWPGGGKREGVLPLATNTTASVLGRLIERLHSCAEAAAGGRR